MATTKNSPKNTRQAKLVEKPVERDVVLDGNLQEVTDEANKIALLEAELAKMKVQLEAATELVKKSPRTAKPKASELKAQREAERAAMSAHLTDEEVAAIAKSDYNNLYAFYAHETTVQPQVKRGKKSTPSEGDIVTKNGIVMKSHDEWKPATHLSADQVLAIVDLHKQGVINSEIARRYNINPTYVRNIITGRQWSRVTGIEFQQKVSE